MGLKLLALGGIVGLAAGIASAVGMSELLGSGPALLAPLFGIPGGVIIAGCTGLGAALGFLLGGGR